jgi:hypothetical protein
MDITLSNINELFNHIDIKKLIVFRYLSVYGNSKKEDYVESNSLSNNDVEKISMEILRVDVVDATENTPKSFILVDAHSECVYNISFYEIPSTYTMSIKYINNVKHLIIYQNHLTD